MFLNINDNRGFFCSLRISFFIECPRHWNSFILDWTTILIYNELFLEWQGSEGNSVIILLSKVFPSVFPCILPKQKISTPEGLSRISQFKKSFRVRYVIRNSSGDDDYDDGWWNFYLISSTPCHGEVRLHGTKISFKRAKRRWQKNKINKQTIKFSLFLVRPIRGAETTGCAVCAIVCMRLEGIYVYIITAYYSFRDISLMILQRAHSPPRRRWSNICVRFVWN